METYLIGHIFIKYIVIIMRINLIFLYLCFVLFKTLFDFSEKKINVILEIAK